MSKFSAMRFTALTTAAAALAALASAQTFTDCNPMQKDCPNDPAMPATFETNFKSGKDAVKGWKQTAGSLNYAATGAEFTISKKGDAPTIQSDAFLHFGYVEVKMRAAAGQGIVSSIVLQSQDLDEVDWEWIGGHEGKVQMNYFGKGNTTTYDRMTEAPVATTQTEVHTYALDWKPESLTWIIDGNSVRTLKFADANGGKNYPQTPCNVRLGNWAGGDSENEGTRQWAGGAVDYGKAPFKMIVESVKITNYNPGTAYKWSDRSGSKDSIQTINAGNKGGAPVNSLVISPSATSGAPSQPLASNVNAPPSSSNGTSPIKNPTPPALGGNNSSSGSNNNSSSSGSNNNSSGSGSNNNSSGNCGTTTLTVTRFSPSATPPPNPSNASAPVIPPPANPPSPAQSGLLVETRPPPSTPTPPSPTGAISAPQNSVSNATASAPASQFTGAAASVGLSGKRGVMWVGILVGGLVVGL